MSHRCMACMGTYRNICLRGRCRHLTDVSSVHGLHGHLPEYCLRGRCRHLTDVSSVYGLHGHLPEYLPAWAVPTSNRCLIGAWPAWALTGILPAWAKPTSIRCLIGVWPAWALTGIFACV